MAFEKMQFDKQCKLCGKDFKTRCFNALWCPDCKENRKHEIWRIQYGVQSQKRKKKKADKTLSEINAEAREKHMSYGEYVEWLRKQET